MKQVITPEKYALKSLNIYSKIKRKNEKMKKSIPEILEERK